ncbi:MAG TPA: hypothetical protein VNR87_12255 [Flavisolibacter sp.]|nr:hypothetical protein [Flavisolibacter sp.]
MNAAQKGHGPRLNRFNLREVNSVIAYAASLVLTGVPPLVCESVLTGFFCSVKKSLDTIMP